MNVGKAHLSGQMSGQAAQMNQVGGGGGSNGVIGADGVPQHQQMQMQDNAVGLGTGMDPHFVLMRNNMREKIFEYIGRKQTSSDWRRRLPELARRLEEILFRKFPSKNEYFTMMKAPVEPHLLFAIKTLSAQNQQMSRQMASSSGYGTMIPTPGITQGASGNSRMSYVTDNMGLSSSGAGMVPQNTMGNSMPGSMSNGYQHLSGKMSGQAAQMNQVGGGGGSNGVIGADGMPQHQQMQMQDNAVGLSNGMDTHFVLMRNNMREKIFEYVGRKQTSAVWRRRLPELARRLEEILFRKFPSKNEYFTMMKAQVEPQLQFAIKTLSAQNQQNHQNQQMSRQMASSSGYGTMIPTPGITQGAGGNSRMSYVTDNMGLSSSGVGMVPQNTNMGNSMPASVDMGGSSPLTTANNQSMGAANFQSRTRMNSMLLTNQLNMQSIQAQPQIKTEVLDPSENLNFQSSQLTQEQLLCQQLSMQQHQVQPNSQFVQNQYHLNQQLPNSQHQQAMLRSNSFKQSQLNSSHSMQMSEQGALPHTELTSSQAIEPAALSNFQGQYQQRSAHDNVKGAQLFGHLSGSQTFCASDPRTH